MVFIYYYSRFFQILKPYSTLDRIRSMATKPFSKIFTKGEKSESKKSLLPALEEIPEEPTELTKIESSTTESEKIESSKTESKVDLTNRVSIKIESVESSSRLFCPVPITPNNTSYNIKSKGLDENNNEVSSSENEAFKNTEIGNTGDQFESIPFSHQEKTTSEKEPNASGEKTLVNEKNLKKSIRNFFDK